MSFADAIKSIEISFDGLVEIFGTDDKLSIGARSGGDRAVEFDGRGQDKTIVVIGMLTDEIHTSRRTIEAGRSAKARAKLVTMEESFSTLGIISDSPSARQKNLPTTQPKIGRAHV